MNRNRRTQSTAHHDEYAKKVSLTEVRKEPVHHSSTEIHIKYWALLLTYYPFKIKTQSLSPGLWYIGTEVFPLHRGQLLGGWYSGAPPCIQTQYRSHEATRTPLPINGVSKTSTMWSHSERETKKVGCVMHVQTRSHWMIEEFQLWVRCPVVKTYSTVKQILLNQSPDTNKRWDAEAISSSDNTLVSERNTLKSSCQSVVGRS